jgi:hypothetical protein
VTGLVRVLVVDQELVRAGLRGILRSRFGFEIVGELPDGTGVVEAVATSLPTSWSWTCGCLTSTGSRPPGGCARSRRHLLSWC